MKRLIVCCDGTWNNPSQEDNGIPAPTNVFKIYNAIADGGGEGATAQLRYYHPGVGGEGGLLDSITGGAVGAGISRNICSAYQWLATNYEEGDQIYLFGFSRGAFTARSLGGFLGRGLLNLRGLTPTEAWLRVHQAYDKGYRSSPEAAPAWAGDWPFFHERKPTPIRFIGVWDTVGALGVPDDLEIFNFLDDKKKWQFHNTTLGHNVATARHAMAIDEVRSCFSVTHWGNAGQHPDAVELWFPGVHADVGGGYANSELAHGALRWMMEESAATRLTFRDGAMATIQADPLGVMHNSYKGAFAKLRSRPRNIEAMVAVPGKPRFHPSAFERQRLSPIAYPAYHPTRLLAIGETHTVDIFADTHWNPTGLYLPEGQVFTFAASGEWQDSKDACDWQGTQDSKLTTGDIVRGAASLFGRLEEPFKKLTGNQATDFWGTKRVENLRWFVMVGAIANDGGAGGETVANDGTPVPHQYVDLTAHQEASLTIAKPGYLYCFPNDAWGLYGNNHGSIRLTIRRVA